MKDLNIAASTPEALFSGRNLWQAWLDVEVALAHAQAGLGVIPGWAHEGLAEQAFADRLGLDALEAEAARTEAPILALTHVLAERAGEAGNYVHWGATTQNVMQTGRLLLMRLGHGRILDHLAGASQQLAALAETHAQTPMAGRTNRRHALPISFGFKVAGWIEELARVDERLENAEQRVFALPFGGAVGAMHAFGDHGRSVNREMARALGLRELLVPGRVVNDLFAEYVVQCSLLAMTIERIAGELYRLMSEEIGEVVERSAPGVVGSSTMPHKVNPKRVVKVIAMAARLRALAAPAMDAGQPSHEGDSAANHLLSAVLDEACPLAWRLAAGFDDLLGRIEPQPGRMSENLQRSGAFIASENLMMVLAPRMGRTQAHDLVHALLDDARRCGLAPGRRIEEAPEVLEHLSVADIRAALDPAAYMGASAEIAREGAALGRRLCGNLRRRAATTPSDSLSR